MPRGGVRQGAGRRKGSWSAKTKLRMELELKALTSGAAPLDVMLEAMREAYAQGGAIAAFPLALIAAPYMHPRLARMEATIDGVLDTYATAALSSNGAPGATGHPDDGSVYASVRTSRMVRRTIA